MLILLEGSTKIIVVYCFTLRGWSPTEINYDVDQHKPA